MWIACSALLGCPASPQKPSHPPADANAPPAAATPSAAVTPTASVAASTSPSVEGMWRVTVTSSAPGINPALFDTPEKRAKLFFDHQAQATGGNIKVTQRSLGKEVAVKDPKVAVDLDKLVRSIDWAAVKQRTEAEEPTEGATQFKFEVVLGDQAVEMETTNLDDYPDLANVVGLLRLAAGVP